MKTYRESESGAIILEFIDGTEAETDILIGCDGIKSATRATMYRNASDKADTDVAKALLKHVDPAWTGTLAYRSLVETSKLIEVHPGHQAATTPVIVR